MNHKKSNDRPTRRLSAARLWAEVEDHAAPRLVLGAMDRVLYFYLLRKARLEGQGEWQGSIPDLASALDIHRMTARITLHRLENRGLARVLDRGRYGVRIAVRLPEEVRGCVRKSDDAVEAPKAAGPSYYRTPTLRMKIYERDAHRCFYCRRTLNWRNRVLDHVTPRSLGGDDSYRNLVACCLGCSSLKCNRPARFLLNLLRRTNRISQRTFQQRRRALARLRDGLLRPAA
jgi:5-methylcytosine-specific restriction endonuclease McrA